VGGGRCTVSSGYADLDVLVDMNLNLQTCLSENPKGFEGRVCVVKNKKGPVGTKRQSV
jgi:hypothetical protein